MSFKDEKIMKLSIYGIGIILYSDYAVSHIKYGENYLEENYTEPVDVLKQIYSGSLVGFGTGSSGTYHLQFLGGYPNNVELQKFEYKLRLGINVKDNRIIFRDLYDLMEWNPNYPDDQVFPIENGYYHITLCSNTPKSGILGNDQKIFIYFNKLESMPKLKFEGVPMLCY